MSKAFGVVVYEILPSGCLNGVYTNLGTKRELYNELARKQTKESPSDTIIGNYDCFYFDMENERVSCTLNIEDGGIKCQYLFKWFDEESTEIFNGEGWKTSDHQIVVQYR